MKNYLFLFFLFIFLIFVVNPIGDFPLNDDWRYAYPVMSWLETGSISMSDDFAPTILLQVIWAYFFSLPFGDFSFTTLRFSVLILAFLGIGFFYRTTLELTSSKKVAFFGAIVLMLNPLYFNLSFSFMTDVPFLFTCLATIFAMYFYFKKDEKKYLIFIILGSIASFLIRQPGILFLPVLGLMMLWKKIDKSSILSFVGMLLLSAAVYMSFDVFLKPLMNIEKAYVPVTQLFYDYFLENPLSFVLEIFKKLVKTIIYIGFFSLPILPFIFGKIKSIGGLNKKIIFPLLIFNIGLLFFLHSIGKIFPFGGNIMYNFGLGPELLKDTYTLEMANTPRLPMWTMYFFNFIGQVVGCWIILMIIKTFHSLSDLQKRFFKFLFLLNAIYLPLMSITSFYDRYLLLTFASVFLYSMLFVDLTKAKLQNMIYLLPIVLMSYFAIAGTKDYLSWHRTKLEAFHFLEKEKVDLKKIDAGFELNGWYNFQEGWESPDHLSFWWVNDDEYIISFGKIDGYDVLKKYPFWSALHFQNQNILILKRR